MSGLEEMGSSSKLPYSYHTFLYPFRFGLEKDASQSLTAEEIKKELDEDWLDCITCDDESVLKKSIKSEPDGSQRAEYEEEDIWRYNEYQYFFPKARNNLFNNEHNESLHFYKKHVDSREFLGNYTIKRLDYNKTTNVFTPQNFCLQINGVKLSIYPKHRIGVLVLETEYHPDSTLDKEQCFENACRINDYGRRVFAPNVNWKAYKETTKSELFSSFVTADEIILKIDKSKKDDSQRTVMTSETLTIKYPDVKADTGELPFTPNIRLIRYFLGNDEHQTILKDIEPILDDRMFTVCLVRDDRVSHYAEQIVPHLEKTGSRFRVHSHAAQQVYRFIFMDGVNPSCQSPHMLREKLQMHLYDRWANWGTWHGASEYSLVCATGEDEVVLNSVIYPFLYMYVDMAKLAIVQRSEIASLEKKMCETIKDLDSTSDSRAEEKTIDDIRNFWKEYVIFEGEVFLPEVTFQEQGVELYAMLKRCLKIDVLMERLDSQMDNMKSLADMTSEYLEKESSDRLEKKLNILAVVGFTIALFCAGQDFMAAMLSMDNYDLNIITVKYLLGFGLLGLLSGALSKYLNYSKEPDNDTSKVVAFLKRWKVWPKVWPIMWGTISIIVAWLYLDLFAVLKGGLYAITTWILSR